MQTTTYQYVLYTSTGSHTRQPRAVPAAAFINVPGATEPSPIHLVEGSMFQANPAPESYPGAGGVVYQFAFMNVSGLAEGGRISYDHAVPPPAGTVGSSDINVLVVYVELGGGGGNGGPTATTIDAFDETLGVLVNDTFVKVFDGGGSSNPTQTTNGNVDGYVDTTNAEVIQALSPINPSNGTFDKWGFLYQSIAATMVDPADSTKLDAAAGDDSYAFAFYRSPVVLPCPYVTGGYTSPDIKLYDLATNLPVTLTDPSGYTSLQPNTLYGLSAVVHNDTDVDAINTDVTFWEIPDGAGIDAVLLNTQRVVVIPAHGSVEVRSAVNFMSGGSAAFPGVHNCAAVSVYNYIAGCCSEATTAAELIALSNIPGQPSCSAWRNTDAMTVNPGKIFHVVLGLGAYHRVFGPGPVEIQVEAKSVPLGWWNEKAVREAAGVFKAAGAQLNNPLYLLPGLQHTLKPVDLDTRVNQEGNGKLPEKNKRYILEHEKGKSTNFTVSGIVPVSARKGDIYLVNVTAHYPAHGKMGARAISFLEVLHVSDKPVGK